MSENDMHWPATKGLSVYNFMRFGRGPVTVEQIQNGLSDSQFSVSRDYVMQGIEFLVQKKWLKVDGANVVLTTPVDKSGHNMAALRCKSDADLRLKQ